MTEIDLREPFSDVLITDVGCMMDGGEQSGQGRRRLNRGVRRRHWGSPEEGGNGAPVAKLNVVFVLRGQSDKGSSPRGSSEGGDGQKPACDGEAFRSFFGGGVRSW
jgi:hypothetical protein